MPLERAALQVVADEPQQPIDIVHMQPVAPVEFVAVNATVQSGGP